MATMSCRSLTLKATCLKVLFIKQAIFFPHFKYSFYPTKFLSPWGSAPGLCLLFQESVSPSPPQVTGATPGNLRGLGAVAQNAAFHSLGAPRPRLPIIQNSFNVLTYLLFHEPENSSNSQSIQLHWNTLNLGADSERTEILLGASCLPCVSTPRMVLAGLLRALLHCMGWPGCCLQIMTAVPSSPSPLSRGGDHARTPLTSDASSARFRLVWECLWFFRMSPTAGLRLRFLF